MPFLTMDKGIHRWFADHETVNNQQRVVPDIALVVSVQNNYSLGMAGYA